MKQITTIQRLKEMFPKVPGIDVALLYGSFGRQEPNPNSDIDIQLIVKAKFIVPQFIEILKEQFSEEVKYAFEVKLRKKLVLFLNYQPKIEFALCSDLSEIDRNYLGSEIQDYIYTILYELNPEQTKVTSYLRNLIQSNSNSHSNFDKEHQINNLLEKFIYEFENCSNMHKRSDAYQFYFFYNIAFQTAIQLSHLSKGFVKYNFLPKYYVSNVLNGGEREIVYQLNGTLYLPDANKQKRKLINFFYSAIEPIVDSAKFSETQQICEWIFERDFLWNFRDISTHNPRLKRGVVYRTATMTFFQNETRFNQFLKDWKISTIIDLRAQKEIDEHPYSNENLSRFKYVHTAFDPWNQPDWFIQNHHYGTNEEIAYRFFAVGCNTQIKAAIEAILKEEDGAVAIHCFAGKDRTGIFISMLHLLAESPLEVIYADYLASEVDVKLSRLELVLNLINEKGGIVPYFLQCGLTQEQIQNLKSKLLNE